MLKLASLFFCLFPLITSAQWMPVTAFEFSSGINSHRFFDAVPEKHEYRSSYQWGRGYNFRIGLRYKSLIFKWPVHATLGIDRVRGSFEIYNAMDFPTTEAKGEIDRTLLTLTLYGANFKLWKDLGINLGWQVSQLLTERAEGRIADYIGEELPGYLPLKEEHNPFSEVLQVGFIFRLEYPIKLYDGIHLNPYYAYLFNFLPAFRGNLNYTHSMQHYFGIGLLGTFKEK